MKLTIDNLNGAGETDYSALLDAEAPPKIVRKLNQPPVLTAWLACQGANIPVYAGSKVRLYRDLGGCGSADIWRMRRNLSSPGKRWGSRSSALR
jgi:hypothetical protein